jgi:outer membrane protein assembly factor BamB
MRFGLLLLVPVLLAADWPHWRGPTRDGLTTESSGYEAGRWVAKTAAWSASVGEGSTSPVVVKDRLYVLGHADKQDTLWCLDLATGKEVWKASRAAPLYGRHHRGDEVLYGGPSSTPEYDGATGFLYTLSCDGDLVCRDTARRGAEVWSLDLYDRHGMKQRPKVGVGGAQRDYGYTTAPVVYRDWLLVEAGGKDGTLIAYDKRTGKKVWGSACRDLAGHTGGPALITVEGVPCVVVLTTLRVVVIRLDARHKGETLGTYPWPTEFANNIASPVVHGDAVLVSSAYNMNALVKLRATKAGLAKVWQVPYPSKACTPVVHKGSVYFAWQKVHCLDLETGKPRWAGGAIGDPGSCVVTADDRLVVWGHNGRLMLVEGAGRSPREYRELARLDRVFSVHAWPHVVLASGRVVCKDRRGNLKCFLVPKGP